jgi:2-hydroxychromene-2-carboxylate isomerase
MLALGLWGVPSFRVDAQPARWGQDRLWQVERDLAAATAVAGPR